MGKYGTKDTVETVARREGIALDGIPANLLALPVKWNGRLRTSAGRCVYQAGGPATRLELNPKLYLETSDALRDTFLHELAHAVAGHDAGHGPAWKAAARRLGGSAETHHAHASMTPKGKLVGRCDRCGYEAKRSRALMRGRIYRHKRCGGEIVPV